MSDTRRDFLRKVGVAGGAGVMYGTMGALGLVPAAAQTSNYAARRQGDLQGRGKGIIVLGGIAGLTAA